MLVYYHNLIVVECQLVLGYSTRKLSNVKKDVANQNKDYKWYLTKKSTTKLK